MHTAKTTPAIVKHDPAHNDYAMALVDAIGLAAGAEHDGSALVEIPGHDASTSPWLITEPPQGQHRAGWVLSRRTTQGGWSDVLSFHRSIDAAAAVMRTFDEAHPPSEPLAEQWWPAEPLALAA